MNCGCWKPTQDHGDPVNLTLPDLETIATAGGTTTSAAAWNIPRTLTAATGGSTWPPALPGVTGKPSLIFDMDGVLSCTAEMLCAALNARYGTSYTPGTQTFFTGVLQPARLPLEQRSWLLGELTGFRLYASCAVDWRAAQCMLDAAAAGFPVQVVTARPAALGVHTGRWLRSQGVAPVPPVTGVGTGGKPGYLTARYGTSQPAVLIDDNPAYRASIARDGLEVWTPARPYTPDVRRAWTRTFTTWAECRYWLGLTPAPVAG